jgi:aryl sulfotransferase
VTGQIVWLASYPKSGSTWLRAVYTALRRGAEPDINRLDGPGPALRALFDQALAIRSADLSPDEVDTLRPRADEAAASLLVADMLRKIHDALFATPDGELIVSTRAARAGLYMVRDPRDVAVSWAHHSDLPLAAAVDYLCASTASLGSSDKHLDDQVRQRLGNWSQHVRSWTEDPPFPVHVVRYEDCLTDPVGTFRTAFTAIGVETSVEELARAVSESSFERLRAQETAKGFRERRSTRNQFFRTGPAGTWRSTLPPELAQKLVDQHGEVMARHGYVLSAASSPSRGRLRTDSDTAEPVGPPAVGNS